MLGWCEIATLTHLNFMNKYRSLCLFNQIYNFFNASKLKIYVFIFDKKIKAKHVFLFLAFQFSNVCLNRQYKFFFNQYRI